jgi:hypothetical protein
MPSVVAACVSQTLQKAVDTLTLKASASAQQLLQLQQEATTHCAAATNARAFKDKVSIAQSDETHVPRRSQWTSISSNITTSTTIASSTFSTTSSPIRAAQVQQRHHHQQRDQQ